MGFAIFLNNSMPFTRDAGIQTPDVESDASRMKGYIVEKYSDTTRFLNSCNK